MQHLKQIVLVVPVLVIMEVSISVLALLVAEVISRQEVVSDPLKVPVEATVVLSALEVAVLDVVVRLVAVMVELTPMIKQAEILVLQPDVVVVQEDVVVIKSHLVLVLLLGAYMFLNHLVEVQ